MEQQELIDRINYLNLKLLDTINEASNYFTKIKEMERKIENLESRVKEN